MRHLHTELSGAKLLRRISAASLLMALVFFAACSQGTAAPPPSAASLLSKASAAFNADTALHFTITASNIQPGVFAIAKADGDFVRPGSMKVTADDNILAGITQQIHVIFINGTVYADLSGTGIYSKTTLIPDVSKLFDPQVGIGAIINQIQSPSVPSADTVNGVSVWKISGTISNSVVAAFFGGASQTASINVTLWIGQKDSQIYQVSLKGIIVSGDTNASERVIALSQFNEHVTITAP